MGWPEGTHVLAGRTFADHQNDRPGKFVCQRFRSIQMESGHIFLVRFTCGFYIMDKLLRLSVFRKGKSAAPIVDDLHPQDHAGQEDHRQFPFHQSNGRTIHSIPSQTKGARQAKQESRAYDGKGGHIGMKQQKSLGFLEIGLYHRYHIVCYKGSMENEIVAGINKSYEDTVKCRQPIQPGQRKPKPGVPAAQVK